MTSWDSYVPRGRKEMEPIKRDKILHYFGKFGEFSDIKQRCRMPTTDSRDGSKGVVLPLGVHKGTDYIISYQPTGLQFPVDPYFAEIFCVSESPVG